MIESLPERANKTRAFSRIDRSITIDRDFEGDVEIRDNGWQCFGMVGGTVDSVRALRSKYRPVKGSLQRPHPVTCSPTTPSSRRRNTTLASSSLSLRPLSLSSLISFSLSVSHGRIVIQRSVLIARGGYIEISEEPFNYPRRLTKRRDRDS